MLLIHSQFYTDGVHIKAVELETFLMPDFSKVRVADEE